MLISSSSYSPPLGYFNKHLQTILPAVFRSFDPSLYSREKFHTPDGDFLNLDWIKTGSSKCVILSHGLEGDSHCAYMIGMARHLSSNGYDVCAWNFRGCGDEMNNALHMYHSGFTDDLHIVVEYAADQYEQVFLVGFSTGGNITLKYLGEAPEQVNTKVKASVTFSVPIDLYACSIHLEKPLNSVYKWRFLRNLKEKIIAKEKQYPEEVSSSNYHEIKTLKDFDDRYTAPFFGFKNAADYYEKCSSRPFIPDIRVPSLIVNSKNDPFIPDKCYPIEECKNHSYVDLEVPEEGGHVGFFQFGGVYWSEERALSFFENKNETKS